MEKGEVERKSSEEARNGDKSKDAGVVKPKEAGIAMIKAEYDM